MRNFRLLKPEEIEVRVQNVKENGLVALLYKTARTDYALLDETYGAFNWKNDYKEINGKMYCGIGIKNPDDGEWVWKWNVGTESETEAEKGQASDAMKRAGFCWGLGTELYSSPFVWIPAEKCSITQGQNGKFKCFDQFTAKSIEYDDKENIKALVITNAKTGAVVFSSVAGNYTPKPTEAHTKAAAAKNTEETGEFVPTCKNCGAKITPRIHDFSVKKFGAPYCMDCQDKIKANANR